MKLPKNKLFGILSAVIIVLLLLNGDITIEDNSEVQGTSNSNKFDQGQVTKIVDGDTIYVFLNGEERSIRLIGVDSPETKHPTIEKQCYGDEASDYLETLILNKKVTLEKDKSDVDRYGRLLRYVYLEDVFINKELVINGYAFSKAYSPDTKHQEVLDLAQQQAKQLNLGLWSDACNY